MSSELIETESSGEIQCRFSNLRGVRWRIGLGILPSSPSSSIDDLRRVTANSRRRYAALRRQLLIDHHIPKDDTNSPDLVIDNPLSQDPDSMWGRFFKNAELERMVDQDLNRLYPEHGSYFQTTSCQSMLRRVLLLWCLKHPEYGYRQGMHEVMAPLLYVLHVDIEHLSEIRKKYEDYFTDKFDGFSFHENDLTHKFDFKKFSVSLQDENGSNIGKISSNVNDLDPKIQTVVLLSDAYGAEGELGVLLSDKFMEHDAYCMFDALMNGAGGAVSMAEFFSTSRISNSHSGFPPVIEASATLYHLLSIVDSSIHTHFVELGVEPQYFSLRWLRVLFGREFELEDLLVIWDEIFACDNTKLERLATNDFVTSCSVLDSSRGGFISAFAVSMILNLRSTLLATETATSCLQRLLNFPTKVNLGNLIKKAKSLQFLALEAINSTPLMIHSGLYDGSKNKSSVVRGHSHSLDMTSPRTPLKVVKDSYWEEKWRVMHKEEEERKKIPVQKKGWSEKVRFSLSRTNSDPVNSKVIESKGKASVRRSLLDDLARQLGLDGEDLPSESLEINGDDENNVIEEKEKSDVVPSQQVNDYEIESERSSVGSNLSLDENYADAREGTPENLILPVSSDNHEGIIDISLTSELGKSVGGLKERILRSNKFQWLWKFGRPLNEGISEKGEKIEKDEKGASSETIQDCNGESDQSQSQRVDLANPDECTAISKDETVDQNGIVLLKDQNVMVTLKNLGQTMIENIQVIESAFQQERVPVGGALKNDIVGRGQVTAMAALKELRKISNLLSEL